MPFLDQQSMQNHSLHTPRNSQDLPQSENLDCDAAIWAKTALAIFQF